VETSNLYPKVGLAELDDEHLALGAALQRMIDAMLEDDRDRTLLLADRLATKVEEHFRHEERLMREIQYAECARHAQVHQEFLAEAKRQLDRAREHGLSADFLRWASELNEWFYRHVMTEDRWLADAIVHARAAEGYTPAL
jgi:hemerythrin